MMYDEDNRNPFLPAKPGSHWIASAILIGVWVALVIYQAYWGVYPQ